MLCSLLYDTLPLSTTTMVPPITSDQVMSVRQQGDYFVGILRQDGWQVYSAYARGLFRKPLAAQDKPVVSRYYKLWVVRFAQGSTNRRHWAFFLEPLDSTQSGDPQIGTLYQVKRDEFNRSKLRRDIIDRYDLQGSRTADPVKWDVTYIEHTRVRISYHASALLLIRPLRSSQP